MRFLVPAASTPVPPWLIWTMRLLASVALGCGVFLSLRSLQSGPVPGCDAESAWDCDHVLTSAWSRWLEIPVSYLGTLTYLGILGALMLLGPKTSSRWQKTAWTLLIPLVVMAAVSAIWFTGLQVFAIGKLCPYCVLTHTCGLMILVLLCIWAVRYRDANVPPDDNSFSGRVGLWISGGLMGGAILILGQIIFPHDTFIVEDYVNVGSTTLDDNAKDWVLDAPGGNDEEVTFAAPHEFNAPGEFAAPTEASEIDNESADTSSPQLADQFADDLREPAATTANPATTSVHTTRKPNLRNREHHRFYPLADAINVNEFPILGDVEAPHLIVEMADYTCHHCRDMYHHIEAARQHYGDQLAVLVRPIALERSCNPYLTRDNRLHENACKYVRLALAVWDSDATKFAQFHHWLMGPKIIPTVKEASSFAAELIGDEQLRASVRSADMMGMLGDNHLLWKRIGGTLPFLFAGGRLLRGMPRSDEHFIETLADQFELKPVSTP